MIFQSIDAALKKAVRECAESLSGGLDLAYENREFDPKDKRRYAQVVIVPAPSQRMSISGNHRFAGSLSIVVAVLANNGSGEACGLVDAFAKAFPADRRIPLSTGQSIRITSEGSIKVGYSDGKFWRIPLIVPFEAML